MTQQSKRPNSVTSEEALHSELRKAHVSQRYLLLNPNNILHRAHNLVHRALMLCSVMNLDVIMGSS